MIHAILYVIFILPFTLWLGHRLKVRFLLRTHAHWVAWAIASGLIGSFLSFIYQGQLGNFLLHSIGGGVASTLLFIYCSRTLKFSFDWQVETLLLFGFVSSLGVLNEFAEYCAELLGFGILSFDTHDTWRDLVANTSGALLTWFSLSIVIRFRTSKKQG